MSETASEEKIEAPRRLWSWKILPMFAMTGIVLWVLIDYLAGRGDFFQALQEARWQWIGLPLVLVSLSVLASAYRWSYVVHTMDYPLPYGRAFSAVLATWPLALVTPSRASDFLRAVAIRDLVPVTEGSGSVLAEKAVDVQSLCLLSLVGAILTGLPFWAGVAGTGLLAVWTAMALLFFNQPLLLRLPLPERFSKKIQQLFEPFSALRKKPFRFLILSAISLGSWLIALSLVGSLLWILKAGISPTEILALWPLAIFVGMLPLTMAGMGTRDAAFIGLLTSGAALSTTITPLAEANVLAATFAYALLGTWLPALVGLPFMMKSMYRLPEPKANIHDPQPESTP